MKPRQTAAVLFIHGRVAYAKACLLQQDNGSEPPRKRARPSEDAPPGPPMDVDDAAAARGAGQTAAADGRKRARSPQGDEGPAPRRRRDDAVHDDEAIAVDHYDGDGSQQPVRTSNNLLSRFPL